MKIQYASDLHLEFTQNAYFLHSNKLIPRADILVLAGDIYPFFKSTDTVKYFDYLSESFEQIFWLPGNHEYYYEDIVRFHKYEANPIRDNIHIVNNNVITLNGVNLIFSTLWGHISPQNELYVKSHVSDFSTISIDGEDFRPKHFNQAHDEAMTFLIKELESRQEEKNVVITHHVPTLFDYHEEYKKSPICEVFVIELYNFIEKYQPEAWIYGHSHCNTPEFKIGKTRMLTNQLGYVSMGEHKTFKLDAILNI